MKIPGVTINIGKSLIDSERILYAPEYKMFDEEEPRQVLATGHLMIFGPGCLMDSKAPFFPVLKEAVRKAGAEAIQGGWDFRNGYLSDLDVPFRDVLPCNGKYFICDCKRIEVDWDLEVAYLSATDECIFWNKGKNEVQEASRGEGESLPSLKLALNYFLGFKKLEARIAVLSEEGDSRGALVLAPSDNVVWGLVMPKI